MRMVGSWSLLFRRFDIGWILNFIEWRLLSMVGAALCRNHKAVFEITRKFVRVFCHYFIRLFWRTLSPCVLHRWLFSLWVNIVWNVDGIAHKDNHIVSFELVLALVPRSWLRPEPVIALRSLWFVAVTLCSGHVRVVIVCSSASGVNSSVYFLINRLSSFRLLSSSWSRALVYVLVHVSGACINRLNMLSEHFIAFIKFVVDSLVHKVFVVGFTLFPWVVIIGLKHKSGTFEVEMTSRSHLLANG